MLPRSRRCASLPLCVRWCRRLWPPPAVAGFFGKVYEYEEDVYLSLDGSAELIVNASIPALVTLARAGSAARSGRAPRSRSRFAPRITSPLTEVTRVSRPWRRHGRRFVQVRLRVDRHPQADRSRAVLVVDVRAGGEGWADGLSADDRRDRRCGRARCRTSAGAAASSWRSGSTCRARSSITTPATSRPTRRATSRGEHPVVGAAPDRSPRRTAHLDRSEDGPSVDSVSHAVALCRRLRRRGPPHRRPHLADDAQGREGGRRRA